MIQRKQTLWLLLSVIAAVLTFKFPFFNGTVINGTKGVQGAELTATDNIFLMLLTSAIIIIALVTIFMYKNRKLQIQLTFLGLFLSVGLIALYYYYTKNFELGGRISLTALLSLLTLSGFFMGLRGIRKDQKLIKDLNRLR